MGSTSTAMEGSVIEWQISDMSLAELIDWIDANRYIRDFTCEERENYRLEPMCTADLGHSI